MLSSGARSAGPAMPFKIPVIAFVGGILVMFAYMYWQKQFSLTVDAVGIALAVMLVVGILVRLISGPKKGK